jgi:hypothetical protein
LDEKRNSVKGVALPVSVVTRQARGRGSGAEVKWSGALVWTIREGKVVRVVWFRTRAEALEAAGLSE